MQKFSPIQYIMIDIANHYGMDKCSWQERISWVANNDSTLEYQDIDADSPILYSKAVRAYREAKAGNPIGHMVSLDSTWSGGQIMAVLMRCTKTAEASNMIDTGKRVDIYTVVKDYMNDKFGTSITRQDMKDCLMPRYYGSKATAINTFGKATPELYAFIDTCKQRLPGAEDCLQMMQQTWDNNATHHVWPLLDGHIANVPVMDKEKKRIKIGDTSFTHIANVNKPVKDGLAMAANFIQGEDGYIVSTMGRKAKRQSYDLVVIHDSFWCHPNYMQQTRENYLSIMINMAKHPIMCDWLTCMGFKCVEDSQAVIDNFVSKLESADYFLS